MPPSPSPRRTRAGTGIGQGPQPVAAPPGAARTPGRRRGRANAREAPTQAAAVIRQPEDEAHVDTDTALDIGNDTEHLLQDAGHPGRPRRHGPATEPAEAGSAQAAGVAGVAPDATAREGAAIAGKGKAAPAVAQAPAGRPPGAGAGNRAEQPSPRRAQRGPATTRGKRRSPRAQQRGEPKYCRSSRNASKSCAASRTCARPNWKSAKPASSSAAWNSASASRAGKRPREAGADRQGFQRDRTVQYRSARHQSYRVEAPGRERSRTGIRFSSGKGRGADTGPRPFIRPAAPGRSPSGRGAAGQFTGAQSSCAPDSAGRRTHSGNSRS